MKNYKLFFCGKWQKNNNNYKIIKKNPKNNLKIASYLVPTNSQINKGIKSANTTQLMWNNENRSFKFNFLIAISNFIKQNKRNFAQLESAEVGKPLKNALAEIEYCSELWKYAASLVNVNHDENYEDLSKSSKAKVIREPVGTVAIILPWNFPMVVLSERLPFVLAAGCSAIIKPSEHASGSILKLCEFFSNNKRLSSLCTVFTGGADVAQKIILSKNINMVSFTGSTTNGQLIANLCSKDLKKISLELGGKNTSIIFDDANIRKVSKVLAKRFLYNSAQACISPSKILVQKKILKLFKKIFIEEIKKLKSKNYGPITTNYNLEKVKEFYYYAKKNEKIIYDGNKIFKKNYFEPVILENVSYKSKIYDEEIFGPIIYINSFSSINKAVKYANHTKYGLACYIFTNSKDISNYVSRNVNYGRIWINEVEDFPQMSIGGFKQSGIGRESGKFGINNYSEFKSIIIGKEI